MGESTKLQKQSAYKYKGKQYHKHVIVLPEEMVRGLGWKEGQQLKGEISENKLVLTPSKIKAPSSDKSSGGSK